MSTTAEFSLRKWYLDCVADNGDTFVGYSAALQWKAWSLHYSSITTLCGNSALKTETSLRKSSFPQTSEGRIDWSSKPLHIRGTWALMSEPICRTLYDSAQGNVRWSCVHPRAKADISFGTNGHIAGLGYAELLELTIKPWQLHIAELRWGRFLSGRDVIVWIQWKGATPLSLAFHNGEQVANTLITDEQLSMDGGRTLLSLSERTELRKGDLVSTTLSAIPGVAAIVPGRMLHTFECKWRSKGVLVTDGSSQSTGWAIHEIVRFP